MNRKQNRNKAKQYEGENEMWSAQTLKSILTIANS